MNHPCNKILGPLDLPTMLTERRNLIADGGKFSDGNNGLQIHLKACGPIPLRAKRALHYFLQKGNDIATFEIEWPDMVRSVSSLMYVRHLNHFCLNYYANLGFFWDRILQ